jgi:hypothetical protein
MDLCVICGTCNGGSLTKVNRGVDKILEYSDILEDEVRERITKCSVVRVHESCRKLYTRCPPEPKRERQLPITSPKFKRSESFNFKQCCLFCGKNALKDNKNPSLSNVTEVSTLQVIDKIRESAKGRDDAWGKVVRLRLAGVIDLVAVGGRYHRNCYQYFLRPNSIMPGEKQRPSGRPESKESIQAFEKLCHYLERNNECQYTVPDLIKLMKEFNPSEEPISERHLKRKLKEHYKNSIVITGIAGHHSLVCFSGFRDSVLTDQWYQQKNSNESEERKRIVMMAANIIREDVRSRAYDCRFYPTADDISMSKSNLIPESLSTLIDTIILPKADTENTERFIRKSQAIQHCIVSASRPRSFISPILHGLSVHLHRKFGSRLLIDLLSNLGFCNSYKETMRYESSVTMNNVTSFDDSAYVQYIFDNADHNVQSIDGNGTFHVMGGLMCVTPATSIQPEPPFPRDIGSDVPSKLGTLGSIDMVWYKQPEKPGLSKITVQDISDVKLNIEPKSATESRVLDFLWAVVFLSDSIVSQPPGWNRFMESSHKNQPSEKSALIPLPFINNNPSNPSTIYTALHYVANEASRLQQAKVFVTFDQPLCHKAYEILLSSPDLSCIEVRLGGFHLLMSFLGAIGMIMGGSGLEDLWETIYARNTVTQMMNGKQYARTLRAHFLTQQVLLHILFLDCTEKQDIEYNLQYAFSDILTQELLLEDAGECRDVMTAYTCINEKIEKLSSNSRTARLWAQYIEMVELVRLYIKAERAGDWDLHLYCVQQMLPYLHSAGHLNYAKTAHIYLQRMLELQKTMPQSELERFVGKAYFTIRRTDKFWSGTWTDMVIEQYLMRSIKSIGGLTHGRGFKSSTIAKWINTMPQTTKVVDKVECFAGVSSRTSEQHAEVKDARIKRDVLDAGKMLNWLSQHNAFPSETPELISISSGLIGGDKVNCDQAKEVGLKSIMSMTGKTFNNVHLSRKLNVITLAATQKGMQIRDDIVLVDSNQLFHRMVCVVRSEEELKEALKFELAAWPPSLFKDCLMRKGSGKASLVPLLESFCKPSTSLPDGVTNVSFIIDGGYLLHKCVWEKNEKYKDIAKRYVSYVISHYGSKDVTVVFDGYNEITTKDCERDRRGCSAEVFVEENAYAVLPQGDFLANSKNKTRFIELLADHLKTAGITVFQASSDADLLIVSCGICCAQRGSTSVVVGEDTDLLVLLTGLSDRNIYMMIPNKGNRPTKVFSIQSLQESMGDMKNYILMTHALTGCDTTSAIHGKGKVQAFNKIKKDDKLKEVMAIFNNESASPQEVCSAGESFMSILYGGKLTDDLDTLRYKTYVRSIAKHSVDSSFKLESLPPTSDSAKQHSFRAFFQIQMWRSKTLDPLKWGWKMVDGQLKPITTEQPPAPQQLLRLVSCICKKGCEKRSCECIRSGLKCSNMCGYCSGHGCSNQCPVGSYDSDMDDNPEG